MTRAEQALERHRRHAAAVFARHDRAIAQARDELEALRLIQRRRAYEHCAGFELRQLLAKVEAYNAHLREIRRKEWFGDRNKRKRYDSRRI